MIDVAVIIVSWNVRDYLVNCLRSVCKEAGHSGLNIETWVVDNASTDGTISYIQSLFSQVHIIANEENVGFAAANNLGMAAAAEKEPRYFFLLNPDTIVRRGAIEQLVKFLDGRPNAGMAGTRLVYGDGRFQHSAFYFPGITQLAFDLFSMPERLYESRWNGRYKPSQFRLGSKPLEIDHPLGASMMVRATVAEATGGFDESYHMYCEEIDWSWRIHQDGWDIYAVPAAEIVHYGGKSAKQIPARTVVNLWRSRAKLYRKHHNRWRQLLAAKMVKLSMTKKAAKTNDPELKNAYKEVIKIWSNGHVD
ncbi:MAG: glycosyl transferase [Chloroflexi bacterium]|nr:MAG: glycosyl transferase [Chloroflexota bacterium]